MLDSKSNPSQQRSDFGSKAFVGLCSRRTKSGLSEAGQAVGRRNGKKWGGSKKGWRWKVSDEQQAAILEMQSIGKPITQIARITGLSRPSVYRVIKHALSNVEAS